MLRGAQIAYSVQQQAVAGRARSCPTSPASTATPNSTVLLPWPSPPFWGTEHTHFPMSLGRLCKDTSFRAKWPRLRNCVKPSGSLWKHDRIKRHQFCMQNQCWTHSNPPKASLIPIGINRYKWDRQEPILIPAPDPGYAPFPRHKTPCNKVTSCPIMHTALCSTII